jgi:hypothetical protein
MAIVGLITTCGCNRERDKNAALDAVREFQAKAQAGDYHGLYTNADGELRRSVPEQDFKQLLTDIAAQFGKRKRSTLTHYQSGWFTNRGTVLTLDYETEFTPGKARERFIWRVVDGKPILLGYYLNSPEFTSNPSRVW